MKRLGIIGGMGPMATIDLYKKITDLTDAKKDQDHIHIIIDSYPQIEDRTAHIINGEKSPLPRLLESAKRLAAAGADALLMPCNTAHYFADDIQKEISVPLIHMIKCAAEAIKNNYPKAKKSPSLLRPEQGEQGYMTKYFPFMALRRCNSRRHLKMT